MDCNDVACLKGSNTDLLVRWRTDFNSIHYQNLASLHHWFISLLALPAASRPLFLSSDPFQMERRLLLSLSLNRESCNIEEEQPSISD